MWPIVHSIVEWLLILLGIASGASLLIGLWAVSIGSARLRRVQRHDGALR